MRRSNTRQSFRGLVSLVLFGFIFSLFSSFFAVSEARAGVAWGQPRFIEVVGQPTVAVRPTDGVIFAVAGFVYSGLYYTVGYPDGRVSNANLIFRDTSQSISDYYSTFDKNNTLHIIWAKHNPFRTVIYCRVKFPQGPKEWEEECNKGGRDLGSELFGRDGGAYTQINIGASSVASSPDVIYFAAGRGGIMHVFESNAQGNGGSWNRTGVFNGCLQTPVVKVAGNGDTFMVCRNEVGGPDFSWARKPAGQGWSSLKSLGTCTNRGFNCRFSMTVTDDGKAVAMWGRNDVQGAVWNGETFAYIGRNFFGGNNDQYGDLRSIYLFTNPDQSISAVWSTYANGRAYFSSSRTARDWDNGEVIWQIFSNNAMEVVGGAGEGRIHIFGRYGDRDKGKWGMYHSSGPGGGYLSPAPPPNPEPTPPPPPPSPTPAPKPTLPPPPPIDPNSNKVPNPGGWQDEFTGYWVIPPFADFWLRNGGLGVMGRPVTSLTGDLVPGKIVQYFERARLEVDLKDQNFITRGLLGVEILALQGKQPAFSPAPPGVPTNPNANGWQDEFTGFWVIPPFADFWLRNGGLATLGRPITSLTGDLVPGKLVQYFERARLEIAPNGQGIITRGLLGVEFLEVLLTRGKVSIQKSGIKK
jgi:hypothetical protein